jgi:hypothetical protein
MKTLCITGMATAGLTAVHALLQAAGLNPARPSATASLHSWHDRLFSRTPALQPIEQPGRLWDQMAGDVFLANMEQPLWGWCDSRSTWLLPYWRDFDPNICFILVTCTPQQALADHLLQPGENASIDACIQVWQAQHQQMLRFYHRNPQRCLLIQAQDAIANPAQLIRHCNDHWGVQLELPADVQPDSTAATPLLAYLSQHFASGYPQLQDLNQELAASCLNLAPSLDPAEQAPAEQAPAEQSPTAPPSEDALAADFRHMADRSREAERIQALENQHASLTEQKDQLSQQLKQQQEENELLLLQLHQVQEELEHYFLQHQDISQQLDQARQRWQRMLQANPDYADYQQIDCTPGDAENPRLIHWQLEQLEIAGQQFDSLSFSSQLEEGVIGLRLQGQPNLSMAPADDDLWLPPLIKASDLAERLQAYAQLTSSGWNLVKRLPGLLIKAIQQQPQLADKIPQVESLLQALQRTQAVFTQLPPSLRCDQLSLHHEQINPDYEHLWLRLENLSWADQHQPRFEFRLSCANVGPNRFGSHPKLEFPEQTGKTVLHSWFAESYDDFGDKLELRFALPADMDLGVWRRLSPADQGLLSQLIQRLPQYLHSLQQQGQGLQRPWQDWQQLAEHIHRIHQSATGGAA